MGSRVVSCQCMKCKAIQTEKVDKLPKAVECKKCKRKGAILTIPRAGVPNF